MDSASAQAGGQAEADLPEGATTSYWVLQGGPDLTEIRSVFRVRREETGLFVERYDPESKSWLEGHPSLLRYVLGGEVGADQVSHAKAMKLANSLLASAG